MSLGVGSVGEFAVTEGFAPAAGAGVGISGMAWFVAAAPLQQKKKFFEHAPTFVIAPSAFAGLGWLARPPESSAKPIRVEQSQPTFLPLRFIQSVGWFQRADDIQLRRQVRPSDQPTFVAPLVASAAGWFLQLQDLIQRRNQPRVDQPSFVRAAEQIFTGGWERQADQPVPRRVLPETQQPAFSTVSSFALSSGWMLAPQDFQKPRRVIFEAQPAFVYFPIVFHFDITDTDILQLPVDCVLAGQQPYDFSGRDPVITAKYSESQSTPRSRVKRLGGSKPSSSTKSGPLGGSHKE
jgi:hypothetical protein